jgi:hypothetical protein
MTTRIDRNVEKMIKAGAAARAIDQYILAEKSAEAWPRAWHKPADGTPQLSPAAALELSTVYGLEVDGHWRDLVEKARDAA